jgi:hypothetical protein
MSYIDEKQLQLQDSTGAVIDPATEEGIILLRRLVQMLAPIATQDVNQRQRVVIEGTTNINNLQVVGGVDYRYQLMDIARNTFANGIRPNLTF